MPSPARKDPARPRAALYLRVSTGRQAEHDISIPDQRHQIAGWCAAKSWDVAVEFVEAGASGTDDRRPAFRAMIDAATSGDCPFDVIVVHSYSRFFRGSFEQEYYLRKLAKYGIKLVSISQPIGDDADPAQTMMRKVIALFDEYSSEENAKHVIRSMKENARQGFWNGARCPLGYQLVEVEKRGTKVKRALAIEPVEAEIVRLVFRLYLEGDGAGPLGVKEVVKRLNQLGHTVRAGRQFYTSHVHKMLTNTVYRGDLLFNRKSSKTKEAKSDDEVVRIAVPAIIEPHVFEAVQRELHRRRPNVTAPRVVNGPVLLSGLAKCPSCGGGLMLRTGKSGKYRYYACATKATSGPSACVGFSVPMAQLDDAVSAHIVDRLMTPERVAKILSVLASRRVSRAESLDLRLDGLRRAAYKCEEALKRIYKMVEDGAVLIDDVLKDRITVLQSDREKADAALLAAKAEIDASINVSPELAEEFGEELRSKFMDGPMPFRKAYLQAVVASVVPSKNSVEIRTR